MPRKSDVKFIMVHCLATPNNFMEGRPVADVVKEVRRWHQRDNGWKDIAYAGVIHRDGSFGKGRDLNGDGEVWDDIGAGAKGWNHNCVHIALNGGRTSSSNDDFSKNYTPEQDASLRTVIQEIRDWAGWEVPLKGHNEVAAKACPGFQVNRWYNAQAPRTMAGSTTLQATGVSALGVTGAAGTAISQLDGTAQLIVVGALSVALLALLWIARERITKWAKGVH
jgi:N-acetylmuramoyl-L-alanine amidase